MAGPRRKSDSYKLLRQAIVGHVWLTATYQKRVRHNPCVARIDVEVGAWRPE